MAASNSASWGNRSSALSAHSLASWILAKLDEHPHLPGPGARLVRIELQHLRVEPQRQFKIPVLEGGPGLGAIVRLVLHQRLLLRRLVFGLAAQFKINESAHARVALVRVFL